MRDDAEYLAPKIIVKSADLAKQRGRQQIAHRVVAELQDQIPNERGWPVLATPGNENGEEYNPGQDWRGRL